MLLIIAYTGGITLFVAATIAIVMTDIKKVLAYSTVSQLGYMMLAPGRRRLGGRAVPPAHARLLQGAAVPRLRQRHLRLPSRAGNDQDGRPVPKMKITALTMLIGVLAIAGTPLFSGWYSKDAILARPSASSVSHSQHFLLFLLPLVTAGITTFYMFRMWFMTFTGKPRDHHVYEHAHESPWLMTVPLVVLAFFARERRLGLAVWDPKRAGWSTRLHHAQPASVEADFGGSRA